MNPEESVLINLSSLFGSREDVVSKKICDLTNGYALYSQNGHAMVTTATGITPVMFAHEVNRSAALRPLRPVWHGIVLRWLQAHNYEDSERISAAHHAEVAWRRGRYRHE